MMKNDLSQKVPLQIRITEELRSRLEEAARQSGTSMNSEISDRLERSFQSLGYLSSILGFSANKQTIFGIALVTDLVQKLTGKDASDNFTRRQIYTAISRLLQIIFVENDPHHMDDRRGFDADVMGEGRTAAEIVALALGLKSEAPERREAAPLEQWEANARGLPEVMTKKDPKAAESEAPNRGRRRAKMSKAPAEH